MKKISFELFIATCLLSISTSVFAHEGKPHQLADLWYTWSFDPFSVLSLTISGLLYTRGIYCLWRESGLFHGIGFWEAIAFVTGWIWLFIALVSPLHPWGEVLFSAHMTQHEILMLVSAPLFILGRPFIAAVWALPSAWRKQVGIITKNRPIAGTWKFFTNPFVAWAVHASTLWIWHIPFLFQATLKSDLVHTLQHISFFLSALLFWWAIIASPRGLKSYGAGVLYLFTTSIHSGLLGAFLTFASVVYYPAYSHSTASWGLTPIEDQQLGGLIMWVPAGMVYIVAGLLMFAGWMRESERRVLLREREMFRNAQG
jgi:putative membrane protein